MFLKRKNLQRIGLFVGLLTALAGYSINARSSGIPDYLVTVPPSKTAMVPLLFSFLDKNFTTNNRATCQVSHNNKSIKFDITIPIKTSYVPKGLKQRDGAIWNDDRIEIFLQPGGKGPYYQYIINAAGFVYDSKNKDRNWNSDIKYKVDIGKKQWRVLLKIPYEQIGFDPFASDIIKGNVAVGSNEPGNKYLVCWVPMKIDFSKVESFGTMKLVNGKPQVVSNLSIGKLITGGKGRPFLPVSLITGGKKVQTKATLQGEKKIGLADIRYGKSFAYQLEIYNKYRPDLELKAIDENHFYINLRNSLALMPYAQEMTLYIDGKQAMKSGLNKLSKRIVDISKLKEGNHTFDYRFINKYTRKLFYRFKEEVTTIKFKKGNYDITNLDASRYFEPITFSNEKLHAALSDFDLSKGILPEQIQVNGEPVLRKKLDIVFNGKPLKTDGVIKVISKNKNRITLTSKTRNGNKLLKITADFDYDGFVWYRVELSSAEKFDYAPLKVCLEAKLDSDIMLSYSSLYPDKLFSKGKIGHTFAPTDIVPRNFHDLSTRNNAVMLNGKINKDIALCSFISVATDTDEKYRGIGLCTEGPRGWNLSNYDKSYKVVRDGSTAEIVMNISDGKKAFKNRKLQFSFGIQPYPLRRLRNDFHHDWRHDPSHGFNAVRETAPGVTFLDYAARQGLKYHLFFENWTSVQNYWEALDNEERVQKYLAVAKKAGIEVFFYFGFLLSNEAPSFKLYHDILFQKPTKYPKPGFQPYKYYKSGNPDQDSWTVCYASPWGDRYARGIAKAVKHYGLAGVYFDGTLIPGGCANHKHGCGTLDVYGRSLVTFPVRAYRRLSERIYNSGIKIRPDFAMDLHTSVPYPPVMGLLGGYYTREDSHLYHSSSYTAPGTLRCIFNGRLYGIPCDGLRRPECSVEGFMAQVLLVDVFPRAVLGLGPPFKSRTPLLWKLYEKYNLTNDTFTPFWVSRSKVKKNNDAVLVSYYETDKVLVVVASTYWSKKQQNVTLDLSAFENLGAEGTDIWRNRPFNLKQGKISLLIPKHSLALLVIEKSIK